MKKYLFPMLLTLSMAQAGTVIFEGIMPDGFELKSVEAFYSDGPSTGEWPLPDFCPWKLKTGQVKSRRNAFSASINMKSFIEARFCDIPISSVTLVFGQTTVDHGVTYYTERDVMFKPKKDGTPPTDLTYQCPLFWETCNLPTQKEVEIWDAPIKGIVLAAEKFDRPVLDDEHVAHDFTISDWNARIRIYQREDGQVGKGSIVEITPVSGKRTKIIKGKYRVRTLDFNDDGSFFGLTLKYGPESDPKYVQLTAHKEPLNLCGTGPVSYVYSYGNHPYNGKLKKFCARN